MKKLQKFCGGWNGFSFTNNAGLYWPFGHYLKSIHPFLMASECLTQFIQTYFCKMNKQFEFLGVLALKIFHFARFDLAAIKHYLDIRIENVFCTKIASRLVRTYTEYHSLRELCRELLGVQISKQQQSTDWGTKYLSWNSNIC